ncbi:MAG: beta-ketoacyl synthase chain length factor [Pseudomonadota bacterium]
MRAVIQGVGVVAPGLQGWTEAAPVLRAEQAWQPQPLEKLKPAMLPPNERRRTTTLIKLALQAADEAREQSGADAAQLASVFSSSDGDTFIVDRLCEVLTLPERPVSPTQFHNSVHNAAAGYWAIAGKARRFSTSISAAGASFAAGLLEAVSVVAARGEPVLLVSYDVALPEPLDPFGINHESFATALVLAPEGSDGLATVALQGIEAVAPTPTPAELESLRRSNPTGESLPLLAALAAGDKAGELALAYLDGHSLKVGLSPCR